MKVKLERLAGKNSLALERIDVKNLQGLAYELMQQYEKQPEAQMANDVQGCPGGN